MAKEKKAFVGEFKEMLKEFIKHKRILRYKYETIRDNLRRFSEYTLNYNIENMSLSKELVLEWTARRKYESVKTWEHRSSDLRQFALYLQSQGFKAYIPLKCHSARREEYIPYIFIQEELIRFFKVVDSIPPNPKSNKHEYYPLLFRLLYCCGLRVSEACNLKISDVNFDNKVLVINGAKFNKDRLVPMSIPLADIFAKYHALFNANKLPEDYFFRKKNGKPLTRDEVYKMYRKLLWKAMISHGGKGKGPRLHDLSYPNQNKIPTFFHRCLILKEYNNKRFGFYSRDVWSSF